MLTNLDEPCSKHRARKHAFTLAAFAVLCAGSPGLAADSEQSLQAANKLAAVRASIADIVQRRGAELAERDALSARLRTAELDITAKRRRLEELHAAQLAAERRRGELRSDELQNQMRLDVERAALAGQMRAAYMIGRQQQVKMLLNQNDPPRLGRMLAYDGYLGRERVMQISAIQSDVGRLQTLVQDIERQSAALKNLEADSRREIAGLSHARALRADALAALNSQVKRSSRELAGLKREEQAVESLLADLARVLQDFPVDAEQSFDELRGKLPWPVHGRMSAHYHDLRADSRPQDGMRWNGVMIETVRGAKVRAAYFGRVVYADWLQGLGLLLIIAHSGGYLSLYGHAEVLYKSVGDWVAPNDVIAALSDVDGAVPQLYFEIRQGRKPVDPKIWLKPGP